MCVCETQVKVCDKFVIILKIFDINDNKNKIKMSNLKVFKQVDDGLSSAFFELWHHYTWQIRFTDSGASGAVFTRLCNELVISKLVPGHTKHFENI